MRYFLLAGEPSGDLHGAGLVEALQRYDTDAVITGWGGDKMEDAGAAILKHYKDLAFMGFVEVVANLPKIMSNFRQAKRQIRDFKTDALILIDYPGFNLRMAKWAAERNISVFYYISPQLWAWKEGRVETVRSSVDRMYVILPFEKQWYAERNVEVEYVGHPLLEAIERHNIHASQSAIAEDYIALLPGSRAQEIQKMLPVMLKVAEQTPERQFVVAAARHIEDRVYERISRKVKLGNVRIHRGSPYDVLSGAQAALTTSGTATLETALFGVPQVVCYKGNQLSFEIARRLVKVPFISLVNLIAGKPVVEELIQENMNPGRLAEALDNILDPQTRTYILEEYNSLRSRLDEGGASENVAKDIVSQLRSEA